MDILLNTTASELERLGGDFTHYRDWLKLSSSGFHFAPIADRVPRQAVAFLRKAVEKSCRTWQPTYLRQRLFLLSRLLYIPGDVAAKPDAIFSHVLFPCLPSGAMPIVWSSQGISPSIYYERYNQGQWTVEDVAFVYRVLGRQAAALMIFTHACARNVVTWCPELEEKIWVIPPPVFAETAASATKPSMHDGVTRMLFVGIDAVRKGLPAVVEAFAAIRQQHPNLELEIVSQPPAELQARIRALSGVRLHLSSLAVDVKALMARADIFVLPTCADTFALAAVEAMAHGCAVLISDLEPLPEVIPDGVVGFTVPADNVSSLASKMAVLITEPHVLRNLQANARRKYSTGYSPDVVRGRLATMFEHVIRRRAA